MSLMSDERCLLTVGAEPRLECNHIDRIYRLDVAPSDL